MLFTDFIRMVESQKNKKPILFELLSQQPVEQDQIDITEAKLGIHLPKDYKDFLLHFHGGVMAFVHIYTLEELLIENKDIGRHNFLAISDNGCGDMFGYCIEGNETTIYQYEHEGGTLIPKYDNLFSFIIKIGFNT